MGSSGNCRWFLGCTLFPALDMADELVEVRFLLGTLRRVGLILVLGLLDRQRVGDPACAGEDVPVVECQEAVQLRRWLLTRPRPRVGSQSVSHFLPVSRLDIIGLMLFA